MKKTYISHTTFRKKEDKEGKVCEKKRRKRGRKEENGEIRQKKKRSTELKRVYNIG